jgi:hypothetical protein
VVVAAVGRDQFLAVCGGPQHSVGSLVCRLWR